MRLFGKLGDGISHRDRAEWITPPFDLNVRPTTPLPFIRVATGRAAVAGAERGKVYTPGPSETRC